MHYSSEANPDASSSLARTVWVPLTLIVSLFFLWGMANNLNDILIKQFKKAFELSDFQAGLVQSAFYLGYFLFAIPAGMFMRRYSYKAAVLLGLLLYALGAYLFIRRRQCIPMDSSCSRCSSSPAVWLSWRPRPIHW